MKRVNNGIAFMFLIVATGMNCLAQDSNRSLLKQVVQENQETVDAIAMYPTETRKTIFEAAEYPEVIAKLHTMQKNSQDAFEKLISFLSKEEQEKIWNLTRYDGLISDLVSSPNMAENDIDKILVNYPEEIHKTALEEWKNNYDQLVQIDKMNKSYNSDFESLMSNYTPAVLNVFNEMIKMPEVLNMLFDHMQYTVVVGDYYKKNPERVLHKTDSLNLVLTQKNTQETDDWEQSMNDNPQAKEEFTQAAQEYAQENGYQPQDYNASMTPDVTSYSSNPYNWWFGYPSWYPYNYWNPYPYWYDWGFYYGPNKQVVFFGLPSSYFMEWYFYYPEHSSRYAELSNYYYNYYNKHRESMNYNSISHSVNDWRNRNKDIITDDWDKDNIDRTQRFKEYGKMEAERKIYNAKNPLRQVEQPEYLQTKQNKYPLLSADVSKKQLIRTDSKTKVVQENISEPVKKPTVVIPTHYVVSGNEQSIYKNPVQNSQQPIGKTQNNNINTQQSVIKSPQTNNNDSKNRSGIVEIQKKNPIPSKQTGNFNQIRNAQQYHQNTWKQIQQQSQPVRQTQQQSQPVRQTQQQNRISPPVQQKNR
ncbi:MAG: hypothetical protein ABR974_13500 [Bacteroidales bacterium]|jgi:hypothetical protein